MLLYRSCFISPLGKITLCGDDEALTQLFFDDQAHAPLPEETCFQETRPFRLTHRWLEMYFGGLQPDFTPPLRLQGTPVQRAVWNMARAIPYGQTLTYGEVAARLSQSPAASRAVGNALGRNPILLIVPCHRVLGAGGQLSGYAAGPEKKRQLLLHKGAPSPANRPLPLRKDCDSSCPEEVLSSPARR